MWLYVLEVAKACLYNEMLRHKEIKLREGEKRRLSVDLLIRKYIHHIYKQEGATIYNSETSSVISSAYGPN